MPNQLCVQETLFINKLKAQIYVQTTRSKDTKREDLQQKHFAERFEPTVPVI